MVRRQAAGIVFAYATAKNSLCGTMKSVLSQTLRSKRRLLPDAETRDMNDDLILTIGVVFYSVLWAATLGAFKPLSMNRSGIYILVTGLGAGLVFGADRFIQEGIALNALAKMLAESAYLALVLFLRSVRLQLSRSQEIRSSVLVLMATMLHLTLNVTLKGGVLFTVMAVQIVLLFCWVLLESYLLWRSQPSGMTLMLVILVALHVVFEITARSVIGWNLMSDPYGTGANWKQLLDTWLWITFSVGYVVLTATAAVLMEAFRSDKFRLEQVVQRVEARLRERDSAMLALLLGHAEHDKDRGMASLAHELRQPLHSIQLNAEYLSSGKTVSRDEEAEILRDILRENRRAADLVQGLRNIFIESATMPTENLNLTNWLHDWVQNRSPGMLKEHGILLHLQAQSDVRVKAHAAQIEVILQNLVLNAQQALSAHAHGTIHISLAAEGPVANLDVIDSGPGLARDLADRIFEMGYTTRPQGMGLGLWLSRRIALNHGGMLLNIPVAQGTCMRLSLPLSPQVMSSA